MAEKQPTSYVVCRYRAIFETVDGEQVIVGYGDNIPVKVFDTRREAREYVERMDRRTKRYGYSYYPVKQG